MAAKPSDFTENGIVKGVMDLNFKGVPIRWAAPESLLSGHYSIYSDVWSVNILADEILNYAAWPYSDISDADIEEMVIYIVFTHLKPQGFNRPRRVQGLILEGLSSDPNQRLKLEALKERLIEIVDSEDGGESCSLYDKYSVQEGCRLKTNSYYVPPLTEIQQKSNSVFKRGIPESIEKFRNLDEDPLVVFHREAAEYNSNLKRQTRVELIEISSNENYKIEFEDNDKKTRIKVTERVTDEFQKFTYHRLGDIDSSNMCVKPWPPHLNPAGNEFKLEYAIPRSTHLLDIVLHKDRGETIDPYIQLLYELAKHVDSLHSAGWIFRCLRAKNVWILDANSNEGKQKIVVPKFGKYRMIFSPDIDEHLEQVKIENQEDKEGVHWLPIEAIKAGLYSKESDVYAFGMITWEVMTAFGQEGVVYDQDEEQELECIPFNYQQSENILQHLIKGYIPEKPAKCPDWFYQEITRPCLLHQKIDRPSMKTVLQTLQTRLKKTIPKQINSISSTQLEVSNDADIIAPKGNIPRSNKENERLNDRYENTSRKQFRSLPTSEPDTPEYINEEMYESEVYACADTNPEAKGNKYPSRTCPSSYLEPLNNTKFYENESLRKRSTQQTHSRPPILLKGFPNVEEYDYVDDLNDERESGYDDAISLPKLTPICLKINEENTPTDIKFREELSTTPSYYNTEKEISRDRRYNSQTPNEPNDDYTLPVMTQANRDENQNQEPDIHKKSPPVPRRKDSIHIPNTLVQTFENNDKEQDVKIAYVKPIPPVRQKQDSVKSAKRQSSINPKRTNDDSITDLDKNEYKTLPMYSNYGYAKNEEGPIPQIIVSENQSSDSKMRTGRRSFNISDESLQSVYRSSDFDATQSNAIHDEMRETFKGSDIVEIFSRSRGDSQERSNIDLTVRINKYTNVIVESSPAIQTTRRRVPPEPNTDPRSNNYVNKQGTEVDSNPTGMHVYVNEKQIEAKPPVPPRKPLNK